MSITYSITTNFGAKDSLPSADPNKVIKGSEFTTEFNAIKTAFTLAAPAASPTFTGTSTFSGAVVTNSTLTANGTNTFGSLTVSGATTLTGGISGNTTLTGDLEVTGALTGPTITTLNSKNTTQDTAINANAQAILLKLDATATAADSDELGGVAAANYARLDIANNFAADLGIGKSPTVALDIADAGATTMSVRRTGTVNGAGGAIVLDNDTGNGITIGCGSSAEGYLSSDDYLRITSNATDIAFFEQTRIAFGASSRNYGTATDAFLQVVQPETFTGHHTRMVRYGGNTNLRLMNIGGTVASPSNTPTGQGTQVTFAQYLTNGDDVGAGRIQCLNTIAPGPTDYSSFMNFSVAVGTSLQECMRVTENGYVNVGNAISNSATPAGQLNVADDMRLYRSAAQTQYMIHEADSTNNRIRSVSVGNAKPFLLRNDESTSTIQFAVGGASSVIAEVASTTFRPGADNTFTLGTSGRRWTTVYATTGTINTSDSRLKENVINMPTNVAYSIINDVDPVRYKWKGETIPAVTEQVERQIVDTVTETVTEIQVVAGIPTEVQVERTREVPRYERKQVVDVNGNPKVDSDGEPVIYQVPVMETVTVEVEPARNTADDKFYLGYIAQDARDAFQALGQNPADYGMFVHDAEADRWGLRYTEMLAPMHAVLKDLVARVTALETP